MTRSTRPRTARFTPPVRSATMRAMRVVVSDSAVELIHASGGQLYVWPKQAGCCGSLTTLVTSCVAPKRKEYPRVAGAHRLELFLPPPLAPPPPANPPNTSPLSRPPPPLL